MRSVRAGKPRRLPAKIHLPSGVCVAIDGQAAKRTRRAARLQLESPWLEAMRILRTAHVIRPPTSILQMPLADFHVLRAFLIRAGIIDDPPTRGECENCGRPFRTEAIQHWETGPFVHGELDDSELDLDRSPPVELCIPPVPTAQGWARTMTLSPRTVAESRGLVSDPRDLRHSPRKLRKADVVAMGIQRLGSTRRLCALTKALRKLNRRAWAELIYAYESAHYSPRMSVAVRCRQCGAANLLMVPAFRELSLGRGANRTSGRQGSFWNIERFEREVRRSAQAIYRERSVQNIDLWIDTEVPLCDEAGEPLLGCYTPGDPEALLSADQVPEIRLFYRTFKAEFSGAPEDVIWREIRETIDHEVQHHLYFLAGADPMDEEEHRLIDEEHARRLGRTEAKRLQVRSAREQLLGLMFVMGPLLLVAVVLIASHCKP